MNPETETIVVVLRGGIGSGKSFLGRKIIDAIKRVQPSGDYNARIIIKGQENYSPKSIRKILKGTDIEEAYQEEVPHV